MLRWSDYGLSPSLDADDVVMYDDLIDIEIAAAKAESGNTTSSVNSYLETAL